MCGCVWAFHAWLNTQQEERQMETERWKYLSRFKGIMRIERDRLHVRKWVINKKTCLHSLHHTHQQLPLMEQKILDHFYVFWSGIYMISIQQAVLCILLQMYSVLAWVILTIVMFPNAKRTKTSEALWALFVAVLQTWLNCYAEDPMWLVQHTGGWCKLFLRQL